MGFLSGIFSGKQARQDIYRDDTPVESTDNGLSGVAKYINAQVDKPVGQSSYVENLSGVGEYIKIRNATSVELTSAEKDVVNARINAIIEQRKIEESMMSAENEELSGVARYVESQEQAHREALEKEQAVTGVAKYLNNIIANKPATTGVSRYLFNRVDATVSSVDRYVINKALADKNKPEAIIPLPESSVTKYLENKSTLLTSSVARYLAKQAVAAKQVSA